MCTYINCNYKKYIYYTFSHFYKGDCIFDERNNSHNSWKWKKIKILELLQLQLQLVISNPNTELQFTTTSISVISFVIIQVATYRLLTNIQTTTLCKFFLHHIYKDIYNLKSKVWVWKKYLATMLRFLPWFPSNVHEAIFSPLYT